MEPKVFEKFCSIAQQEAGIKLKDGKEALVAARVARRLRALGLASERAYLEYLRNDDSGEELTCFLDAISTNFTSFMREADHFESLSRWAQSDSIRSRNRLRLWCAAAATGEEPYTIAITLLDAFENHNVDFKILATDISTRALTRATRGRYEKRVVEPLSARKRKAYFFLEKSGTGEDTYVVRPEVKEHIVFRRLNLDRPPFPMKGPLDVVFCRNVMIYFNSDTRRRLILEIERLLAPGGTLFTGHSETLAGIHTGLKIIRPSVYRKPVEMHGRRRRLETVRKQSVGAV